MEDLIENTCHRILAIEKENLQLIPPDKRRPYFIATDEIDPPTQGQVAYQFRNSTAGGKFFSSTFQIHS